MKQITQNTKNKINKELSDLFTADDLETIEKKRDTFQRTVSALYVHNFDITEYSIIYFEYVVPYINSYKKGRKSYCEWKRMDGFPINKQR